MPLLMRASRQQRSCVCNCRQRQTDRQAGPAGDLANSPAEEEEEEEERRRRRQRGAAEKTKGTPHSIPFPLWPTHQLARWPVGPRKPRRTAARLRVCHWIVFDTTFESSLSLPFEVYAFTAK